MTIVVTGAGSGGHITPTLAVAHEIKILQPDTKVIYIGQTGDSLADIPRKHPDIDEVYTVSAGKFRRYHHAGFKQLFDIPTYVKNIRDGFRFIKGIIQSYRLLGTLKPDIIFIKGGYIGVPVGLAAALKHISYITHDSDALPGLANRIIARWASLHTTGLPKEYYNYPSDKTEVVGVPISGDYTPVTREKKEEFKKAIKLQEYNQILLVTGGGLGAQRINEAMVKIMPELLEQFTDLAVVHFVGRANEAAMQQAYDELLRKEQGRLVVKGFVSDFYLYSGAADVIVTRAGATNLTEFAVQEKPCIVIPNPYLVGGHQLKNAEALASRGAIKLVDESEIAKNAEALLVSIKQLLTSSGERQKIALALSRFAQPNAANKLASILLGQTARE